MFRPNIKKVSVTLAACVVFTLPASAETKNYTADLTASAEVPSTVSPATGTADVVVDTDAKTVSWTVKVEDLTGEATAAHIHGPADKGVNASPVIDMSAAIMQGSADITDEQISEIEAGKYYVNVHTEKYPDGEVRGQLESAN